MYNKTSGQKRDVVDLNQPELVPGTSPPSPLRERRGGLYPPLGEETGRTRIEKPQKHFKDYLDLLFHICPAATFSISSAHGIVVILQYL